MGIDASARLFYGFFADKEDSAVLYEKILAANNGDWDELKFLANLYGLTVPHLRYYEIDGWREENVPIRLHGYNRGGLSIAVMVEASYQFVLQIAEKVDPKKFQHQPIWDEILGNFCKKAGIKLPTCGFETADTKFWCLPEYG